TPAAAREKLKAALVRLDALASEFPTEANARQHQIERHYNLGQLLGDRGQFAEAAVAFGKAIELRPDEPYFWYTQAIAHLAADDESAYRKVCAAMLERFGVSREPNTAARLIYACVPGHESAAEPARLIALADAADPRA